MMKLILHVNLLLLFTSFSSAAVGPFDLGNNLAADLWKSGDQSPYPCSSLADVLDEFVPDVEDIVYEKCEVYPKDSDQLKCKDGATHYLRKQAIACECIGDCYCKEIGNISTEQLAADRCPADPWTPPVDPGDRYSELPPELTEYCKDFAKDVCKISVGAAIQENIGKDYCPDWMSLPWWFVWILIGPGLFGDCVETVESIYE